MDKPTRILVADEDARLVHDVETMLKQALPDICIVVAHDWAQALNILFWQDNTVLPHLIILDLTLPQTSGLEVLKQIKQHPVTQSIPVIMLSKASSENSMVNCYAWGAASFLRKPIKLEQLVAVLQYCLAAKL